MDGRLAALGAVLLALLSACQLTSVPDANQPRFEVAAPDGDFPVSVPSSFDATLGWLVVSENREKKAGSEIRLPVAIIHSQAETKKSPVVYLAGGPGTSAMRTAAFPGAYPWLQDRDFIVIGQRGTHFAKPALMCPEYREAVAKDQDTVAAITNCNERLQATGIELEHYNSITSAQDLEDLRSVLNIERWSFYAGSYGTRLALIYAKSYGDRLEAMVLDSPLPPNAIYDDESADNLETALRAVAQDCAQSPDCAAAFPDLETRFFQTLEATSTTPVQLDGSDRTVSTPQLVSLVPMTSEAGLRQAPMTMDRIAKLDPALLNRLAGPSAASDFAWGMRLSVWCAEALPFSRRSTSSAPDPVLGGYESAAVLPRLCKAWGVPALDESVVEPVVSDVPTLIIAGEFDPLTPPIWGKRAAETLSQSQVIVIRGGGHSSTQQWGGDGCAMQLASDFFSAPQRFLTAGEATCAASRGAPQYTLPRD